MSNAAFFNAERYHLSWLFWGSLLFAEFFLGGWGGVWWGGRILAHNHLTPSLPVQCHTWEMLYPHMAVAPTAADRATSMLLGQQAGHGNKLVFVVVWTFWPSHSHMLSRHSPHRHGLSMFDEIDTPHLLWAFPKSLWKSWPHPEPLLFHFKLWSCHHLFI